MAMFEKISRSVTRANSHVVPSVRTPLAILAAHLRVAIGTMVFRFGLFVFAFVGTHWHVPPAVAQQEIPPYGARVYWGERTLTIPELAFSPQLSCAAVLPGRDGEQDAHFVFAMGRRVPFKGRLDETRFEPGDRLVFVNLNSGEYHVSDYHQPLPDISVASPDGRYVAFGSVGGWGPPEIDLSEIVAEKSKIGLNVPDEQVHRLNREAVGSLRYSIWSVSPVRLEWEMRYSAEGAEHRQNALFRRPWDGYVKFSLPWWVTSPDPQGPRSAQIVFSPSSEYFVALDKSHGIHVLRMRDGVQIHCCGVTDGLLPIRFMFSEDGRSIQVFCGDGFIRKFQLESGNEVVADRRKISKPLTLSNPYPEFSTPAPEFCVSDDALFAGWVKDKTVRLASLSQKVKSVAVIRGIGSEQLSFVEVSRDGRTLGLGYSPHSNPDMSSYSALRKSCSFYELANREEGRVVKRIVGPFRPYLQPSFSPDDSVETYRVPVSSDWVISLNADGSDVVYAISTRAGQ